MKLVLLGAAGSGKGTLAKKITADFGSQAHKHIQKAQYRINRRTVLRAKRRQCVKGSENITRTVNQTNFFCHL